MVLLCCIISAVSNVLPIAETKQLLFCLVTLLIIRCITHFVIRWNQNYLFTLTCIFVNYYECKFVTKTLFIIRTHNKSYKRKLTISVTTYLDYILDLDILVHSCGIYRFLYGTIDNSSQDNVLSSQIRNTEDQDNL